MLNTLLTLIALLRSLEKRFVNKLRTSTKMKHLGGMARKDEAR
jgi:hypothetical protein